MDLLTRMVCVRCQLSGLRVQTRQLFWPTFEIFSWGASGFKDRTRGRGKSKMQEWGMLEDDVVIREPISSS